MSSATMPATMTATSPASPLPNPPPSRIRRHAHADADACSRLERYMDAFTSAITQGDIATARRWLDLARRIAGLFRLTATLANTLDGWRWRADPANR